MADDLRAALEAAKLAGTKPEGAHTYLFHSNETAALIALDVFSRWLFEQANSVMGYALSTLPVDSREREDEMYAAKRLRDFAAHVTALTQPSTEEKR